MDIKKEISPSKAFGPARRYTATVFLMKDHTPKTTTILCPDDFSGGRARFAMVFRLPSLYRDKYGRLCDPETYGGQSTTCFYLVPPIIKTVPEAFTAT